MSSYKPPFTRRLARHTNPKPAPRTAKNPNNPKFQKDIYGTGSDAGSVTEALEAMGMTETVETVETVVAEVEVVETVTADVVETVEDTVEDAGWSMKNTKKELLAAAEAAGLSVSEANNKTEILEALNGAH